MNKILVVDDEEKIRKMICDYLEALGFATIEAVNGIEAVKLTFNEEPDLILMDIMMPGLDGFDCTRRIREKSKAPIIMLTARAEESDTLIGLEMGADDYMVKPFSLKELVARIRALLRRVSLENPSLIKEKTDEEISINDIVLNPEKMSVHRAGQKIELTTVQFEILSLLVHSPGRVFTREQILNSFQHDLYDGYERTIDVHIKNIRKVLEEIPSDPHFILTVWGKGYKFNEGEK